MERGGLTSEQSFADYDRSPLFYIPDEANLGSHVFLGTNPIFAKSSRVRVKKVTGAAVRERGTDKLDKVYKFHV